MKLIKTKSYSGYYYDEILKYLKKNYGEQKMQEFRQWMNGQTIAVYRSRGVVYKWDFERFLSGKAVID